jgi:hypothetical protein
MPESGMLIWIPVNSIANLLLKSGIKFVPIHLILNLILDKMKRVLLSVIPLIFLIMFSFFSCKKDDNNSQHPDTVVGEWTWLKSYGGFTGGDIKTPENTNIIRKVVLKSNGSFLMTDNGETVQRTTYFTSTEKSILYNDTFDFLTVNFKYKSSGTDSITLPIRFIIRSMKDSLNIEEDVFDGYKHEYLRTK